MSFQSILRPPDSITAICSGELQRLQAVNETTWKFRYGEAMFAGQAPFIITLSCPAAPVEALRLRWMQPVLSETRLLGDAWERAYGDLEWRGIASERVMPWYFLAYDGRCAYACGVKTGTAALCSWQVDAQGISLLLDLRCGGIGVQLGERRLEAATLVERAGLEGESPFTAACAFTHLLCDQPLVTPAPVYGANDFYYACCASTQESILRDSRTISELSPDPDNRPFSVADAGWQFGGLANGSPWHISNARFPNMAKLAADIKAAGSRPGIWFRPLLTNESLPAAWTLPDERFPVAREPGLILDPSLPEVLDRIAADVNVFRSWGYELIKHDYTTFDLFGRWGKDMGSEITPPGWSFHDTSRTTAEIVRNLYQKIYVAAGDMVVIGCNTFGHLAAGTVHLQRVGDDTSGLEWRRTRKMGVNSLAFRIPQQGALFAVDADCVGLTENIPWALNSQWLDLLAHSGTPLFVSLQPESLGPEQRAALRQALERAARPAPLAEPLDWLGNTQPAHWRMGEEETIYDWYME